MLTVLLLSSLLGSGFAFNSYTPTYFSFLRLGMSDSGDIYESDLEPKSSRINLKRGLLQGGLFLVGGLIATGENPLALLPGAARAAGGGTFPVMGAESIMSKKAHGTGGAPVQANLRWNCDVQLADRICNYNRMWAENAGYFTTTRFFKDVDRQSETSFYDSVTGKLLFVAPRGRTFEEFEQESRIHGWPSFRDAEVVWDNVRCLGDGETVSTTGTHLGHNLPDRRGNRYCINLVSIAGNPV